MNIERLIQRIEEALEVSQGEKNDSYKLGWCTQELKYILRELTEYADEQKQQQNSDPWGVLGALDEATKIR